MTLQNSANRSQTSTRQAVLSGSVDASGFPNALSVGSGLAVTLTATGIPFELSFAAGFNNGAIDYPGRLITNQSFSSLTASTTCFLYVDRDSTTGALTTGFTTLAPVYQFAAPSSPSTGQHWFDLSTFTMKRWSGSAWVAFQRVFVGEALTGASTVSSATTYAYRRVYQSAWVSVVANTAYAFNHNLGIYLPAANANFQLWTSTTGSDTDNILSTPFVSVGSSGYGVQSWYNSATRTSVSITTKDFPIRNSSNTYVSAGFLRCCVDGGW